MLRGALSHCSKAWRSAGDSFLRELSSRCFLQARKPPTVRAALTNRSVSMRSTQEQPRLDSGGVAVRERCDSTNKSFRAPLLAGFQAVLLAEDDSDKVERAKPFDLLRL